MTFEDFAGRTRLTLVATPVTVTPTGEMFLAGMEEGWRQSIDKLAAEVESQ